jgi:hypothetical protein
MCLLREESVGGKRRAYGGTGTDVRSCGCD